MPNTNLYVFFGEGGGVTIKNAFHFHLYSHFCELLSQRCVIMMAKEEE